MTKSNNEWEGINQSYIKEALIYDKDTGLLMWRKDRPRSHFKSDKGWRIYLSSSAGKIAGHPMRSGHIILSLNDVRIRAHRLIWMYVYGVIPALQIDHINHNRSDNRLDNLRLATNKDNGRNQSRHITNTSGVTGVCWATGKSRWLSSIKIDGISKHLGYYDNLFEAVCARKSAEIINGFHENHGKPKPFAYPIWSPAP